MSRTNSIWNCQSWSLNKRPIIVLNSINKEVKLVIDWKICKYCFIHNSITFWISKFWIFHKSYHQKPTIYYEICLIRIKFFLRETTNWSNFNITMRWLFWNNSKQYLFEKKTDQIKSFAKNCQIIYFFFFFLKFIL